MGTNHRKGKDLSGPVIFRSSSHGLVKAITVFVGKTCGYETITHELMLFTIQALADMVEGEYRDRQESSVTVAYTDI